MWCPSLPLSNCGHSHLASYVWRVHGTGGQPQSELERVAERTVAEGQCVVDGQRGEPDDDARVQRVAQDAEGMEVCA